MTPFEIKMVLVELDNSEFLRDRKVLARYRMLYRHLNGVDDFETVLPPPNNVSSPGIANRGLSISRPAWQYHASCLGVHPDLFFPERGASTREAKATCSECPVQNECLAYNIFDKSGIWGGLSERQRRKIRRMITRGQEPPETISALVAAERLNNRSFGEEWINLVREQRANTSANGDEVIEDLDEEFDEDSELVS